MVRTYNRTSDKQLDRTNLEAAFKHRVETGCSMKAAAEAFGVKKTTLVVSLDINLFHYFNFYCLNWNYEAIKKLWKKGEGGLCYSNSATGSPLCFLSLMSATPLMGETAKVG